jgi:hypothetical protein
MRTKEYIEFIEQFVNGWYKIAMQHNKQFNQWKSFFSDKPYSFLNILPYRYFPEPYIGNPTSKKLKAVFINLNPGTGGDMQDIYGSDPLNILHIFRENQFSYQKSIDAFIKSNEEFFLNNKTFKSDKPLIPQLKKYKISNKEAPTLHDTYAWWYDNRLLWLKELQGLANAPSLNDILGLELTPWHSTNFAEMGNTFREETIWKFVLKPCIEFSKKLEEGVFMKDNKSIVIVKGSVLKDILSQKNLTMLHKTDPDLCNSLNPIQALDGYKGWFKWTYTCNSTGWKCFFLVYTKPGFNMRIQGGEEVRELFKKVISEII